MIPTRHSFRISYTPQRRNISPDPSSLQWLMVHTELWICLSGLTSSVPLTILGILVALFFRCMGALLNPVRRTNEGIKWGLVAHTTAMLLFSTIPAAINRNVFSISYVDSREFSGFNGSPPGPLGYESILGSVQVFVSVVVFPFNQWLADGLLVSPVSNSAAPLPNVGGSFSCIVAMSSIR